MFRRTETDLPNHLSVIGLPVSGTSTPGMAFRIHKMQKASINCVLMASQLHVSRLKANISFCGTKATTFGFGHFRFASCRFRHDTFPAIASGRVLARTRKPHHNQPFVLFHGI